MKNLCVAKYTTYSAWELDFDLETCHKYWVKWDILYVIRNEGDEPEEFEPDQEGSECLDYKNPDEIDIRELKV